MYKLIDSARLQRGRSYARSGQVLNLDIQPGRVDACVQGSRPQPYKVWLKIKPLTEEDWKHVAEQMAGQAIFAAKLLAGEMPQNIEEAFTTARVNLFPTKRNDLETDCSCPDWSNPCKHIAAVYLLLGEQFDADPFLIFRLRGKTKNEIMELLRAQRAAEKTRATAKRVSPKEKRQHKKSPPKKIVPLEKFVSAFWNAADTLEDFRVNVRAAEVDAVVVKCLGAPGFWRSKQEFSTLMERVYLEIADGMVTMIRE